MYEGTSRSFSRTESLEKLIAYMQAHTARSTTTVPLATVLSFSILCSHYLPSSSPSSPPVMSVVGFDASELERELIKMLGWGSCVSHGSSSQVRADADMFLFCECSF